MRHGLGYAIRRLYSDGGVHKIADLGMQMPITNRFVVNFTIIALAIGLLSLLGIVGATVWLGERTQGYFNDAVRLRDTRIAAVELRSAVQSAETSQRGFLVGGNEIYLAPYDNAKAQATLQLSRLQALLPASEPSARVVGRLSGLLTEKFDDMDRTIALKNELRDAEALDLFRTNRGKALMDEANLFLSSIIRTTDARMIQSVEEQRESASQLRWVSGVGGLIIVLVVAGVTITLLRHSREIAFARDEVKVLNATLEQRVADRTADLVQARDKAEVLLAEVNHRVANSLSMVASVVRLQATAAVDPVIKDALGDVESRIHAISSVHKRLYSSGETEFVDLNEYFSALLSNVDSVKRSEGHDSSLRYDVAPLRLKTDICVSLGLIVTEWVTNAYKYAYPARGGEIRVTLQQQSNGGAELVVEDDGVGRGSPTAVKGTGLGTRIVAAMARTIGAEVQYLPRDPGTRAQLAFLPQGA